MKEINDQISTEIKHDENEQKNDLVLAKDKFSINKKVLLGKGSFGKIYLGLNDDTKEEVAIKIETSDSAQPQLKYEYKIFQILQGGFGFPKIYKYSTYPKYNVLVMEVLGDSIESLFNKAQKKFSFLTVLMIIDQILTRIEYMHSKNIIHRDIKPDNFLIGRGNKRNIIYAIDFGLSKKFRDSKTKLHIPYRDGKNLTGTARYASLNTHFGVEQSRRDDIESIGYMMVYLMKGHLPWQGLVNDNPKRKYDTIKALKLEFKLPDLCNGLPSECIKFIQYARDMKFEDKPNYNYLRGLLKKMALKKGLKMDTSKFDWIKDEEK